MGRRMKVDVVANITKKQKVTIKFDKLSLENAVERLREYTNIIYLKGSEKGQGKITKIMVFLKRRGDVLSKPTKEEKSVEPESRKEETVKEKSPRPEPFKFEF